MTVIAYPPLSEGRTEADFDRAAATAQRLGVHPSMISIHEWGHAEDHRPWIVTDPQPAEALDTLLKLVKVFIRPDRSDPAMAAAISETR